MSLSPGAKAEYIVKAVINSNAAGKITNKAVGNGNTAEPSTPSVDPVTDNSKVTAVKELITKFEDGYIAGDRAEYKITVENTGLNSDTLTMEDNLSDVLEYSTLVDNGGGTLNETTKVLSWPQITLKAGSKQTRTFTIKVLDVIPATAQGQSNQSSFDCLVTNTFGNSTSFRIACPAEKTIEKITTELPKTGPTGNIIFACLALAIAVYFFCRTRQLEKEIRIIRNNTNTGIILLS